MLVTDVSSSWSVKEGKNNWIWHNFPAYYIVDDRLKCHQHTFSVTHILKGSLSLSHQHNDVTNNTVTVTVMLMTTVCRWLYDDDSDRIIIGHIFNLEIGHKHLKSVIGKSKLSKSRHISNFRHKHRCSQFGVSEDQVLGLTRKIDEGPVFDGSR